MFVWEEALQLSRMHYIDNELKKQGLDGELWIQQYEKIKRRFTEEQQQQLDVFFDNTTNFATIVPSALLALALPIFGNNKKAILQI